MGVTAGGRGLLVQVVREADGKTTREVAGLLAAHCIKALRRSFHEEEFGNAPILAPVLEGSAAVGTRQHVHLGAAYDHRVVNGQDATSFPVPLKQRLKTVKETQA